MLCVLPSAKHQKRQVSQACSQLHKTYSILTSTAFRREVDFRNTIILLTSNVGAETISADYFGAFCEKMTDLLDARRTAPHPPFVAMLSNGTSGDCNNINFREPHKKEPPFAQINRVADAVAKVAFNTMRGISYHDWVPLKSAQEEITLGVRLPSDAEVTRAAKELESADRLPTGQLRHRDDIYRRETVLMQQFSPQTLKMIISVAF